jgi:hypothetical protein
MLCLSCLEQHHQEEMGSTFTCIDCVDSSQKRLDGNLTGRVMMEALRKIGAQVIIVEESKGVKT